jgi:hypothetical protein
VIRLAVGPRYRAGQPRDDWFAEWFGFYGSCLETALRGQAEDIRFLNGIFLRNATASGGG